MVNLLWALLCYSGIAFSAAQQSSWMADTWPEQQQQQIRGLQSSSLFDTLAADSELTMFLDAVNRISDDSFRARLTAQPYTFFVPINQAFEALSDGDMNYISNMINSPNWAFHLRNWVEYHFTYSSYFDRNNITNTPTEVYMWNMESTLAQEIEGTGEQVLWSPDWERGVGLLNVNSSPPIYSSDDGSVAYKLNSFLVPQFFNISLANLGAVYTEYGYLSDLLLLVWDSFFADPTLQLTLLAPSLAAWDALGPERINYLLDPANSEELKQLLYHHIVLSVEPTTLWQDGQVLETMNGTPVTVTITPAVDDLVSGTTIAIGAATITRPNILARNGILHELDRVLDVFDTTSSTNAPNGTAAPNGTSAPFTTNSPTPAATTTIFPTSIVNLFPTALPGSTSGSPAISPFVQLESPVPSVQAAVTGTTYLDGDADLSSFNSALSQTPLKTQLERNVSAGDDTTTTTLYTVFAPINAVIARWNKSYWNKLLSSDNWAAHLQNWLHMHVVEGSVLLVANLTASSEITMRNNETVAIVPDNGNGTDSNASATTTTTTTGRAITITLGARNEASNMTSIISPDIETDFGVVHKIDSVLVPAFYDRDFGTVQTLYPGFDILFDLLGRTGLLTDLDDSSGWTLLSPTNDAFFSLGVETLDSLIDPANSNVLKQLMSAHLVPTVYPLTLLVDGFSMTSLSNFSINVTFGDKADIQLNGVATIVNSNVLVKNGIVHTIDQVLLNADMVAPMLAPAGSSRTSNEASSAPTVQWYTAMCLTLIAALVASWRF